MFDAIKLPNAVRPPTTKRFTADGWDYGYDSEFYSTQWSTQSTAVNSTGFVSEERKAVMDAVDVLVAACRDKQLDVSSVLHELAFDIDDVALMSDSSVDPFYWYA